MSGPVEEAITKKLMNGFQPAHIQVINESHSHNVPKNSETHFKILMISEKFMSLSRVARQRLVYQKLNEELAGPVHALSLRLLTPEEWESSQRAQAPESPVCRGGQKR